MSKVQEILIKNYAILLRGSRIKLEEIPVESVIIIIDGIETQSTIRDEANILAASTIIDLLNS